MVERKQRLAIVGASVRAAAQSALRAGFDVVGADLFADADLDGVCPITRIPRDRYPHALADWLAEQGVDAWMYTGALENYPDLVDRMAKIAPLWGVSGDALRRCRDPLVLQGVLAGYRIDFPLTRRVAFIDPEAPGWIAKTYRDSSGAGVREPSGPSAWAEAQDSGAYAQRRADGEPYSAVFAISDQAVHVLGVGRQLVGHATNPWAHVGSVSHSSGGVPVATMLARLGAAMAVEFGFRGLVGVDFVATDEQATVVEINPRYTASIEVYERGTGRSAVGAHAACFGGEPIERWKSPKKICYGKRIVFATGSFEVGPSFSDWARECGLADLPRPGVRIESGQPVCTVFAEEEDEAAVCERLKRVARETLTRLNAQADR